MSAAERRARAIQLALTFGGALLLAAGCFPWGAL